MRPVTSAPRLLASALLLLGALAACHDGITSPSGSRPLSRPAEARRLAELECRADLRARTVSCGTAATTGGPIGDLMVGGQGVFVKLTSGNVATTDVPDPAERDTFAFDVTVQNLIPQALATVDGTTAEASGVRVFFASAPKATGGSGTVAVGNADGYDTFTGVNQPFFQYTGLLDTNATTGARRWKLAYDAGVTSIAFRVYVSSVVQYPDGWVEVGYGTLTPQMAPGATGQPTATVRDVVGQVVSETVTYLASSGAVGVSGSDVTAICGGQAVVTASTATRPARLGVAVTVPAPAFASFSPDPYSAAGSPISRTADLSASFGYCTAAAGPGTFVVHGTQGAPGLLGGSYTGAGTSTATYHHTGSFFAGEEVEATLTSGLASDARVVRFRTAAGAASAGFSGPLPTGNGPTSVATGDLNGDGRRDLAVTNYTSNSVSVLLRNAANTGFEPKVDYAAGTGPTSAVIADLNGDGRMDLAFVNQGSSGISVLIRNVANTGFNARLGYPTNNYPNALAIGDLNGDGRLDMAVTAYNFNSVSVLLRNTANTGFVAKVDYSTGTAPVSVAIGDVNGDGRGDLAVANSTSNTVSVLLRNTANTGFIGGSALATGAGPSGVAVGDLNGDGRADLAVANASSGTLSVLTRNVANTGFDAKVDYASGVDFSSLAIGDLNGDSRPDLAVANGSANTVSVLLRNAGNTGFDARLSYFAGSGSPIAPAIGDLNGDGRRDLAVVNQAIDGVTVLLRNAANTGFEGGAADEATGDSPTGVASGDLDGDGRLDLAVTNQRSNTVSVLLRNAANTGFAKVDEATGDEPSSVAVGDLNGDGQPDLAVTNGNANTISVLLRNAANTGFDAHVDYATGYTPWAVAIGDLNGDGRLDLAVANVSSNSVSVLLRNTANTGFDAAVDYALGGQPRSVAIGDLNGDGRLDLAVPNGNTGTVAVLLRNATNTGFDPKVDEATGDQPESVAIADLNGDGRPDLAVVNSNSQTISVLLRNTANTGFDARVDLAGVPNPYTLVTADLNGDGRLDLAVTNYGYNTVTVLLRNAANTGFDATGTYGIGSAPNAIAVADLNADGRLDLAVTNSRASGTVRVLENQP